MKRILLAPILAAAILALPALAQPGAPAKFPVIVKFNDDYNFESTRGSFRADARLANVPEQAYLNPGVVGLTQALERQLGFQAAQFYSAAVKGFAASLTAQQIGELERHPAVELV